jgi:hypothetical protein
VRALKGNRAHNVKHPTCKSELTLGLMVARPAIDRHDHFSSGKGAIAFPTESPSGFLPLAKIPMVM